MNISIANDRGYDTFIVINIDSLLDKISNDETVASIYKKMDKESFKEWVKKGITRKQFEKLRSLHETIIEN